MLNRDIKNVSDDVHYLASIGLVELKTTTSGRKRTVPSVDYDKILLEIPVN